MTSLATDPSLPADVSITLTARQQRFQLPSGRTIDGYTLNGQSPGPLIRVTAGQVVHVRVINESVPDGITLHWHGVDVPNAEDGVAGVTQDAVGPGGEHTYRFIAHQVGTFWYHSHQVSHRQVAGGLLGPLVVEPSDPPSDVVDTVALVHLYRGIRTINGQENDVHVPVSPGQRARVRIINTDNSTMSAWVGQVPFRLLAVDGTEVTGPSELQDLNLSLAAGGRADIEVTLPLDGSSVRVHLSGPTGVVLGSAPNAPAPIPQPTAKVDLLSYGTKTPPNFDPDSPDRTFRYSIGRRPGFINGRPGLFWTVNGAMFPRIPMFMVSEGDVVRMTVSNHSGEGHPMHLHGHHALVLSRNGIPATGSQWWVDSLDVEHGETYDLAFVANNPGIWMDHCHNLPHVRQGLVAHLMYTGVSTPFLVGSTAGNEPE